LFFFKSIPNGNRISSLEGVDDIGGIIGRVVVDDDDLPVEVLHTVLPGKR
jgi:hypothetical protein